MLAHPDLPTLASDLEESFGPHLQRVVARTAQALDACGFDSLLVHAGAPLTVFEDDRHYPFEVHAPFKVWAPLTEAPDSFIWFVPGQAPLLLFQRAQDYWHKPADPPAEPWTRHFRIEVVSSRAAARAALPHDISRTAYIGDLLPELAAWRPAAVNPRALMNRLDFGRAAKSEYELHCLRAASCSAARAHLAAERAFRAGASEYEIELAFLAACGLREQELPYNPIIALNEHGATLHYQQLERRAPAHRLSLLVDAGTEYAGYASDITRTWSAQSGDFAALVAALDALQQRLCTTVRAGVDWRDVHLQAHALLAELLAAAGLVRCRAAEALESGLTRTFMPHGIGHLLGLEVHDPGGRLAGPEGGEIAPPAGHESLRLTRPLEPGFVVTMEPGLYFIEPLLEAARADAGHARRIDWSRIEALRSCGGIRIEDDLAVTAEGCENLTRNAFSAAAAARPARH